MKDPLLVKKLLRKQHEDLGSMTFHQYTIASLFGLLILLWFFRDPGFMPGWINLFPNKYDTPVQIVLVLFSSILLFKNV
jgi:sodium-dependent dicarboxylate transporter 2/3/5